MADIQRLVATLANYRERGRAMDLLLFEGPAAVEPLVTALTSPLEGVRWAAATLLGQLGDARALEPLRQLTSDPTAGSTARESLARLEERLANSSGAAGANAADGAEAHRQLAEAAANGAPVDLRAVGGSRGDKRGGKEGDAWAFRVHLPDGRHQIVRVDLGARDDDGAPLAVVYTLCGPAGPDEHEAALRLNMRLRHGALAISDVEGHPEFVLVETLPRNALEPETLRHTVLDLARRGDRIEDALTGEDVR